MPQPRDGCTITGACAACAADAAGGAGGAAGAAGGAGGAGRAGSSISIPFSGSTDVSLWQVCLRYPIP